MERLTSVLTSEKKLCDDYFEDLNFMVLALFDWGEFMIGSLKEFSSRISPSFVSMLSFPANFYKKEDLQFWMFYLFL